MSDRPSRAYCPEPVVQPCRVTDHEPSALRVRFSMSLSGNRDLLSRSCLTAIAAIATILIAATVDPDAGWQRLRDLPRSERQRLIDNLQKFDMLYGPAQQKKIQDLDRQINALEPERRTEYLVTLRRYHNWLRQLPDLKQSEIKEKSPAERMALVRKFVGEQPNSSQSAIRFIQFVDAGDHSPIELAKLYQIWNALSAEERQQVQKQTENMAPAARQQQLLNREKRLKPGPEPKIAEVDEAAWISDFRTWLQKNRRPLLNLLDAEPGGADLLRRQATNFHFLQNRGQVKPVATDRLAAFLAAFPPWLRSTFDHYPPDEARRRLSVVYRLVYPPGTEITDKPKSSKAASATVKPKASAPKDPTGAPTGKTKPEPGAAPY